MLKASSDRPQNAPNPSMCTKYNLERGTWKIKNKNVHLELVSDTKFSSGFVTDKGCLWDTLTRNYCLYHDRQQFKSMKMSLFLIEPWTNVHITYEAPCLKTATTRNRFWTPKDKISQNIYLHISHSIRGGKLPKIWHRKRVLCLCLCHPVLAVLLILRLLEQSQPNMWSLLSKYAVRDYRKLSWLVREEAPVLCPRSIVTV
jgi:hypothetical protein